MGEIKWRIIGDHFENCNCDLLCPCHVSFKQKPTEGYCHGFWADHIQEGKYGDVILDDLNIVIAYTTPGIMYEGNWTSITYIDDRASVEQRESLKNIFSGSAGGPWKTIFNFVSNNLGVRHVPIIFKKEGRTRSVTIPDILEVNIEAIKGANPDEEVKLLNLYNVLLPPIHILARAKLSKYNDHGIHWDNEKKYALYCTFEWSGP